MVTYGSTQSFWYKKIKSVWKKIIYVIKFKKIIKFLGENMKKKDRKNLTRILGVPDDVISKMNTTKDAKKAMREMQEGKIKTMEELRVKYDVGTSLDFSVRCKLQAMALTWERRQKKGVDINNKKEEGEER